LSPTSAGGVARLAPIAFILLWSGAFVAVRAGLWDVSPLYFLTVRFALAAVALFAIALALGHAWGEMRRDWPHFAIAGILMNALYLGGGYLAMTRITGATLALLGALHPLATALLSGPLLGDRFTPGQWLGFLLGTVGVALVVGVNAITLGEGAGVAMGACAVAFLVAGTLYYSRRCRAGSLVVANCVQLGAAAAVCAGFTFAFEEAHADWTPIALGTLAYLTFGVSLGGMGLLLFMLRTGTAGKVASNFYLIPGVTAVMGWAILGETMPPLAIAGFVVASLGVWLVQRRGPATA